MTATQPFPWRLGSARRVFGRLAAALMPLGALGAVACEESDDGIGTCEHAPTIIWYAGAIDGPIQAGKAVNGVYAECATLANALGDDSVDPEAKATDDGIEAACSAAAAALRVARTDVEWTFTPGVCTSDDDVRTRCESDCPGAALCREVCAPLAGVLARCTPAALVVTPRAPGDPQAEDLAKSIAQGLTHVLAASARDSDFATDYRVLVETLGEVGRGEACARLGTALVGSKAAQLTSQSGTLGASVASAHLVTAALAE